MILQSFTDALTASQCARIVGLNRKTVDKYYLSVRAALVKDFPIKGSLSLLMRNPALISARRHYQGVSKNHTRAFITEQVFRNTQKKKAERLAYLTNLLPYLS